MIKVLFLIHDLGQGGAEKVLVNLVNNMDPAKFDITVMTLFGGGVNEQFLKPHIRRISCFRHMLRGNSHLMKLLTPEQLHRWLIKDTYDIEVSYLEGPSARVISGCKNPGTKILSWIHCLATKDGNVTLGFRSHKEAESCYARFHKLIGVSQTVSDAFHRVFPNIEKPDVLYNVNDCALIHFQAEKPENSLPKDKICLIGIGKLIPVKAFDRFLRVHARLYSEGYPVHSVILGDGELRDDLEALAEKLQVKQSISFLGYQTNPYKYVAGSDIFVCSSYSEGFSTAATEALIVGTPVCTVDVSGMKEMLGENNEYGIVTENNEEALYRGIKSLLDDPVLLAHYREKARERGRIFSTQETVQAVEQLLLDMRGC